MSCRRAPRHLVVGVAIVVSGVLGVISGVISGVVGGVPGVVNIGVGVAVISIWALPVSSRPGAFRRLRSSGLSGRVGWLRVCRGGTRRRLLRAATSVDRLVDYLLDRAVEKLPAPARARFAEEWQDHRQHYCGWRLVWWALWVRATALRTVTALEPARLPREK